MRRSGPAGPAEPAGPVIGAVGGPRLELLLRTGRRWAAGLAEASLKRRRRWAASGRLPPAIAARFTPGEIAVLSVVAAEVCRRGDCRLAVGHIAALSGVSDILVRNAIREARALDLITVEERRVTAWRNDTNVVQVV